VLRWPAELTSMVFWQPDSVINSCCIMLLGLFGYIINCICVWDK